MTELPLLAVVGPTASGKTEASVGIAEAVGAEIVCVDSTLVYRGMDVGTAKPGDHERAQVPHHLLDLADPDEAFSVARFQRLAAEAIRDIRTRDRSPLLVSGGGLYWRAVVDGLEFPGTRMLERSLLEAEASALGPAEMHKRLAEVDPPAAGRIEPANVRRTVRALEVAAVTGRSFSSFARSWGTYPAGAVRAAGVDLPRTVLHRRIEVRAERMIPGLLAETRTLLARGYRRLLASSQAIGYAEAAALLEGGIDEREAVAAIVRRTRTLARRQMAWLRRDPRIRWFAAGEDGAPGIADRLTEYLQAAATGRAEKSLVEA
jgi:tRNA dimethylallyltransferase